MKKGLLTLALVAGSLLSAQADDHVTAFVKPGAQKQLAIQLANEADYTAFQMEITLPEGMTFPDDAAPVLANRKDATHQIHFNKVDNTHMNVVVFSAQEEETTVTGNLPFANNKGAALFYVDVNVDSDFKTTTYDASGLSLAKTYFVKSGVEKIEDTLLPLTVAGIMGDVDGNKKLNTVDATLILSKLLDKPSPSNYILEAEDTDGNGNLNTVDATLILRELLR